MIIITFSTTMEEAEVWHGWNFKRHCCVSQDGVSCHFSPSHLFACYSFNKNLSYHAPNLKSTVEKNLGCSRSGFTNHQPSQRTTHAGKALWMRWENRRPTDQLQIRVVPHRPVHQNVSLEIPMGNLQCLTKDNCERFQTVPQTQQVLCAICTPGFQSTLL